MKKSVVVLIGIIYVAAVALVSFFGLQAKEFNEVVYVASIEILNDDLRVREDTGEKFAIVEADENGKRAYQIEYRVGPDNATNQEVEYVYDKNNSSSISIDSNGVVTFPKAGTSIKVRLLAKDGSDIQSETITLYAV